MNVTNKIPNNYKSNCLKLKQVQHRWWLFCTSNSSYQHGGGSSVLQHDLPLPQTHQQPHHPGLREEKKDYEPPMDTNQGSATPLSDSKPQSPLSTSYPP